MSHFSGTPRLLATASFFAIAGVQAYAQDRILDTVTITAQKREQAAQDTGVVVSALSGDDLETLGVESLDDISDFVPNASFQQIFGPQNVNVTIRGLSLVDFNANARSPASVYVDEVFQSSNVMLGLQLFDLERVEVLRGPQGTLFGRNSTAGAVSVITRKPTQEADGYLKASAGSYQMMSLEGAIGGGISDQLSGRASFLMHRQGEGFYDNTVSGRDIGSVDYGSGRAQLLWEPSEAWEFLLKAHASYDTSDVQPFVHGATGTATGNPAPCAAVLEGRLDPTTCVDLLGYSDTDGDLRTVSIDDEGEFDNYLAGVSLKITADLGFAELTSVTSYDQARRRLINQDADVGPARLNGAGVLVPGLAIDYENQIDQYSQEIRLASAETDPWSWLIGVYAQTDTNEGKPDQFFRAAGFAGIDAAMTNDQETETYAVFGQLEWQATEQLRLIAGLRQSSETISYDQDVTIFLPPTARDASVEFASPQPGSAAVPLFSFSDEIDADNTSWKLSAEYTPTENILAYATVSTGFKSGGFSAIFTTDPEEVGPFGEESVINYEVGVKSDLFDGRLRLNASAFQMDYEDYQTAVSLPVTPGGLPKNAIQNVGEVELSGLEIESVFQPTTQFVLVNNLGILDSEITDFTGTVGDVVSQDPTGSSLPFAPELTYSGMGRYEVPISDTLVGALQLSWNYKDAFRSELVDTGATNIESRWLLNANASVSAEDGRWTVSAFVRNLADEEYQEYAIWQETFGNILQVWGAPRTYGINYTYNFN